MDSKTLALIATLALAITGSMMVNSTTDRTSAFESFKLAHGKSYSQVEEIYRFQVYSANMKSIEEHNATPGVTYTQGENQFTDLSKDEFRSIYLMTTYAGRKYEEVPAETEEDLGSINWVTKGGVQHVKDQGQCGSCWAFSAAAGSESAKFVRTGTLGDFSEQQLTSCDSQCYGCDGGWNDVAMQYYAQNGICTESSYPYTSGGGNSGSCHQSSCTMDSFTISGASAVHSSVYGLKQANKQYPVSICVDAENWSPYSSGIFSNCGTSIDHCVLLAGFSGNSYWLVKNSWSSSWGESGYIRLKGGRDTCGLTQEAYLTTA